MLSDDWTSPVQPKLDLLARLQPNPNKIKGTAQGQVFLAGNTPRPPYPLTLTLTRTLIRPLAAYSLRRELMRLICVHCPLCCVFRPRG